MIHKLEDKDLIKILPMLKKDGSFVPFLRTPCVFLENKIIYEIDDKKYLSRMFSRWSYQKQVEMNTHLVIRYFFCAYINESIRFISVGKTLFELISLSKLNENSHLLIDLRYVGGFAAYDKSKIVENDWNILDDLPTWIKDNQPGYLEDFLGTNSVFKNISILSRAFGSDLLSKLISEDRDKNLSIILE